MPRKAKGIHTSPEQAGEQNLPDNYAETHNDKTGQGKNYLGIWNKSFENRQNYGGKWTEETLTEQINAYFQYCFENEVKVSKVGLSLWLGISKSQFWEWETKPEKYGFKSNLARQATAIIEDTYVGRVESYPTGNIFLLKAMHGYAETQKVEVTGNKGTNPDEVNDIISKLGLDK